jgi:hypothetical protein
MRLLTFSINVTLDGCVDHRSPRTTGARAERTSARKRAVLVEREDVAVGVLELDGPAAGRF